MMLYAMDGETTLSIHAENVLACFNQHVGSLPC